MEIREVLFEVFLFFILIVCVEETWPISED